MQVDAPFGDCGFNAFPQSLYSRVGVTTAFVWVCLKCNNVLFRCPASRELRSDRLEITAGVSLLRRIVLLLSLNSKWLQRFSSTDQKREAEDLGWHPCRSLGTDLSEGGKV